MAIQLSSECEPVCAWVYGSIKVLIKVEKVLDNYIPFTSLLFNMHKSETWNSISVIVIM